MRTTPNRKIRIRKSVAVLASCLVASLALAACAGAEEADPAAAGEPLQFILSGDANQGGGYAAMAKEYEEETGVKVEIVDVPNDDLATKVRNAAQADDLPALARVGGVDPVWMNTTVDLKAISEAHGVRQDLSAIDESGKVLSLPSDVTAVGLFLNKSLFEEAGVSYPTSAEEIWTWDEFVAAAKEVQEKTDAKYGLLMDRTSHRLKSFLYQFGSNSFAPDADGQFQTNEQTKVALEYFKGLNDDKFMPRSVWLSGADPNALFKSGQVAAYYSGSWQIADFAENIADFEWTSVYMPTQPVRAANFGNAASIVVFDGTGQEQQAQDFLNWLYTPANYTKLSETSGFLPVIEGLDIAYKSNAEAFELYNEEIAASDPIVGEMKKLDIQFEVRGLATEGDPIRDETVKYLNDEQDVDTTIANIKEQLTEALG